MVVEENNFIVVWILPRKDSEEYLNWQLPAFVDFHFEANA